jgi:hypothetical protein
LEFTMRTRGRFVLFGLLGAGLCGCEESDLVSLRLRLQTDLAGTLTTSSLLVPAEPGALANGTSGVAWGAKLNVVCATGAFQQVDRLRVGEITFTAHGPGDQTGFLRVEIPRGPNLQWHKLLAPAEPERKAAVEALDADGKASSIGSVVKLVVELPGAVVGHGAGVAGGRLRGLQEEVDRQVATLIVPLAEARREGPPVVWHLSWQK